MNLDNPTLLVKFEDILINAYFIYMDTTYKKTGALYGLAIGFEEARYFPKETKVIIKKEN